MPERISRPPIRLMGQLPDGRNNGLVAVAPHFLASTEQRYAIVRLVRHELTHNDETDADVARVRVAAVAVAPGTAEAEHLAELAETWLAELAGQQALQFPDPAPTDRARYERALAAWQERDELDDARVQQTWKDYFGAANVAGPLGAELPHLIEFVLEVCGGLEDDEPSEPTS